jgi:thiol-disulfide isomerase/thioredoxin
MVWFRCLSTALLASLLSHQATAETVLLDFMSPTCGPCRQMQPVMHQLAAAGFNVREVDTSREPGLGLAQHYRVTDLPTFVVVVGGKERARLVGGGNSAAKLVEMIHTATAIGARIVPVVGKDDDGAGVTAPGISQPGRVVSIDAQPPVSRNAEGPAVSGSANTDALISATVRISIDDPDGKSTGTGTIVDCREGKALVLTCGHLFRTSGGKGGIEVSLFTPGPNGAELRMAVEGTLIDYDLERDLALVCFAPEGAITVAPVAGDGGQMVVGQPATSVGCEHGANPTPWATQITAINRYQGPPNIEAAKAPIEGRSGGGLFNAAGQLVGVCNAADPQRDEGLYASLPSIHAKLDALQLAFVYQSPSLGNAAQMSPAVPAVLAAARSPFEVRGQNPIPATTPAFPAVFAHETPTTAPTNQPATAPPPSAAIPIAGAAAEPELSPQDQAMLHEINRRSADSEVICIIRPREAGGKSEVIKLDRASPALVRALGGSLPAAPFAATASGVSGVPASQPIVR